MTNRSNMIPIPGRLHSVAVGEPVSGADEVLDDALNMKQSEINQLTVGAKNASTGTTGDYPYNGMGRVTIKKNMVSGVNTLMQEAFEDGEGNDLENTVFVIKYDFTLGEDITVPANCVLEFDGGKISGNGENFISGNNIGNLTIVNGVLNRVKCYFTNSDIIEYINCKGTASKFHTEYCESVTFKDCTFKDNSGNTECIYCIDTKTIVYNCIIEECGDSEHNNVRGIILHGDCSCSIIKDCVISGITANTNASGIEFNIRDNKVSYNFLIENCIISDINGISDDGDGIKVIYSSDGQKYSINSSIFNCHFKNCTKRAIKLQAIGVVCRDIFVDGLCSFSVIDFQMGNAYVENLKATNINSYIAIYVAKLVGDNYINNCNLTYTDSTREGNIIRLIPTSDAYEGRNLTITNIVSNRATYGNYQPNIFFRGNSTTNGSFDNVKIDNIKVEQTGNSAPCIEIDYFYLRSLSCHNIFFNSTNSLIGGTSITIDTSDVIVNGKSEVLRGNGQWFSLVPGLYESTPLSSIAIVNKRAYIQNSTNDPTLVTSTWLRNRLQVGDILMLPSSDKKWDGSAWVDATGTPV